jgi:nicotinamidase-related amidase
LGPNGTPDAASDDARMRNAALVIVDMQNDFVRVGAPLEVPDARATIPAHLDLIRAFRRAGRPVVYTKFISRPGYYLLWEWSPACRPPTKCCWKDHRRLYPDIAAERECTDVIDELTPAVGDLIVEKHGYGSFHETDLEGRLRAMGVEALCLTGTVTQICVEETAREAFHRGFRTTVVEDAVSSFAPDLHAATLKNFAMKFGWVEPSARVVTQVENMRSESSGGAVAASAD